MNVTVISPSTDPLASPGAARANARTGLAGKAWLISARKRTCSSYGSDATSVPGDTGARAPPARRGGRGRGRGKGVADLRTEADLLLIRFRRDFGAGRYSRALPVCGGQRYP